MIFLGCFICFFNIVMWIIFISKFKKLFSTDEIIESTKEDMNHIVEDINRNTSRDITLIDDKIKELKAIIAEADRHISIARNELDKQTNTDIYKSRINSSRSAVKNQSPVKTAADRYLHSSAGIQPEMEFAVTNEGHNQISQAQIEIPVQDTIVSPSGTQFTVERDGSSYAQVPVIGPEVKFAENPIVQKADFNSQVIELYQKGFDVSHIARHLNRTTTEVQFVLDMAL